VELSADNFGLIETVVHQIILAKDVPHEIGARAATHAR
jgi:hypothetical protein